MSETDVTAIRNAVQSTNVWLNEIGAAMEWSDAQHSYRLLRAVLHALRDWLTVDEAAQFAAQLPMLVRGIYYEGWNPSKTPAHPRKKEDFKARVDKDFETDPLLDTEEAIAAVFKVIDRHVSGGEVEQVRESLRTDLRGLWPAG